MSKGLFIVVGLMALAAVTVGGSMSGKSVGPIDRDAARSANDESDADQPTYDRIARNGTVELQRSGDGHFYADVDINGTTIRALVDTGASGIALSREDARNAGIATSIGMPEVVGRGADGDVYGEEVMLERVALGHLSADAVPAIVLNSGEQTLLGQSFLGKFDSVEIRADTMTLR